jgi:hypothetical protein
VRDGVVAVAVINDPVTEPGFVIILDTDGEKLHELQVGPKPDTLAFTPDGQKIIVLNQGIPNGDYSIDPEASISIIDLKNSESQPITRTIEFTSFNEFKEELIASGVRIYGPCFPSDEQTCDVDGTTTVAQDLEPVEIALEEDSSIAWVTFETNNALARLDVDREEITDIFSFGLKDHSHPSNRIDASSDGEYSLQTWPIFGIYQPNGIDYLKIRGRKYLITANRGNWREYADFDERTTISDACQSGKLDFDLCYNTMRRGIKGIAFGIPDLKIAKFPYRYQEDPDFKLDAPYSFGGRSFSIWSLDGSQVYDSGSQIEKITYDACPAHFNSQSDRNTFDDRSNEKGPEPEHVEAAKIENRYYAFVTLRRIGGIFVYDVSNPRRPKFQQWINNRDFSVDPKQLPPLPPLIPGIEDNTDFFVNCDSRDLQAVFSIFVPAWKSPTHKPLLIVVNNFSGSTSIYQINSHETVGNWKYHLKNILDGHLFGRDSYD